MQEDRVVTTRTEPRTFPLVFTFKDLLAGRGFIVAVETVGRVILAHEAEGWTIYGVNPGGVAGGAEDRSAALADFRRSYTEVLDDIAHEAPDFAAFTRSAEAVLYQTNEDAAAEWERLRARVRAGEVTLDDMQRHTGEVEPRVTVSCVEPAPAARATRPTPALNPQGTYAEAA